MWGEERIREEEPNLSENVKRALYVPTTAVVVPYELTFAVM